MCPYEQPTRLLANGFIRGHMQCAPTNNLRGCWRTGSYAGTCNVPIQTTYEVVGERGSYAGTCNVPLRTTYEVVGEQCAHTSNLRGCWRTGSYAGTCNVCLRCRRTIHLSPNHVTLNTSSSVVQPFINFIIAFSLKLLTPFDDKCFRISPSDFRLFIMSFISSSTNKVSSVPKRP